MKKLNFKTFLMGIGDWGFGDWGLGIGPNPQSPIPNPQSPIPIYFHYNLSIILYNYIYKYNILLFIIFISHLNSIYIYEYINLAFLNEAAFHILSSKVNLCELSSIYFSKSIIIIYFIPSIFSASCK